MASFFAQCCSSNLQPLLAPEWLSMQTCGAFPRPLLESSSETNLAEAHGQHRQSTLDSRLLEFPAGLGMFLFSSFFQYDLSSTKPSPVLWSSQRLTALNPEAGWLCVSAGLGEEPVGIHVPFIFLLLHVGRCWKTFYQPISTLIFLRQLPAQMLLSEDPWSFPTVDCKGRRQHLLLQFHLVCRKMDWKGMVLDMNANNVTQNMSKCVTKGMLQ